MSAEGSAAKAVFVFTLAIEVNRPRERTEAVTIFEFYFTSP
ncbi:hypothetical protein WAK64_10130 [Bacillus spongiae]|uniref:Uncharacterized protein n=1 Tax=Bacillus spongiae TaxID=2683610 RepID=A0ABU8HE44_9BACI